MRVTPYLFVAILVGAGCQGKMGLHDPEGVMPDPAGQENSETSPNNETLPADLFPDVPCEGLACEPAVPSVMPRVSRLTHHQWENAVRDLLRLPERVGLSSSFLSDPLSTSRFDRLAANMEVTPGLWDDYREAAETLANQVTTDAAALSALEGANPPADNDARIRAFAENFGRRAYRRPLTETEVDRYVRVMNQAGELFGQASFERSAELAIRGFLQSPHFLYRVETHDDPGAQVIALNGFERASKLSFALWNTMPDDELLEAAERGDLSNPDLLVAQVRRMLDDERASDVVADFHAQLLDFKHFSDMSKAPERFPDFNPETPGKMKQELALFIEDVVFHDGGTYRELMTARHSFVDEELAAIYGVTAPTGADFGRVELDASRPGILTRSGFLAVNGTAYDPNPIHRGVFVDRQILCIDLPLPPDDFSIPDGVEGNTNRERIENATGGCGGGCHTPLINPPGFAFENYDAIGAWRDRDGDYDVDASGSLFFDGQANSWQTGAELIGLIAESTDAHECYTRHWFEYINGRSPTAGDEPLVARVTQASHQADVSVKEMLMAMVTSPVFLQRDTGRSE